MPTLPLYDTTAHPDAWHHVTAPGGYERWHFDAGAATGNQLRVHVDVFDGNPFDRAYRGAYRRYRQRPTRVTPPVPREYPCVAALVFENDGRLWGESVAYPPGSLCGSCVSLDVSVASHTVRMKDDGRVTLFLDALPGQRGSSLTAELVFRPTDVEVPPWRRLDTNQASVVHFWRSGRACEVTGTLRIMRPGVEPRVIAFEGRGGHEHAYGTGPITADVERRMVPILNY